MSLCFLKVSIGASDEHDTKSRTMPFNYQEVSRDWIVQQIQTIWPATKEFKDHYLIVWEQETFSLLNTDDDLQDSIATCLSNNSTKLHILLVPREQMEANFGPETVAGTKNLLIC